MTPLLRPSAGRKVARGLVLALVVVCLWLLLQESGIGHSRSQFNYFPVPIHPERHPVPELLHLTTSYKKLPKIQHVARRETAKAKELREGRLQEIKDAFLHAWNGYKTAAWAQDELMPLGGGYKTPFCGWAATMVDSLDTLWIMGLYDEFELSLVELNNVDFTNTVGCQINLFETTIRHLGGLLAAWDISGEKYPILVHKAVELAEILYTAFDTPNRMPSPHFVWSAIDPDGYDHKANSPIVLAVLGSLSLEFTRLAQITGNDKYFDGIQRVMNELDKWQNSTGLPGMWPAMVNANVVNGSTLLGSPYVGADEIFTLGALADSTYEYLPKQYMLLGGQNPRYKSMYLKFVEVAKRELFFRPMTVGDEDILISGTVHKSDGNEPVLDPELQHLTCFTGGMLAIAGKIFNRPADVEDGRRLTDGCIWAYKNTVTGIMPESFRAVPCQNVTSCKWDMKKWYKAIDANADDEIIREKISQRNLSPGFASVHDSRYLLRPEAIESVFIMYRVSGDEYWRDSGWTMFKSIMAQTTTDLAHAAIDNVMSPAAKTVNEMESFWLAETLKYFYMLYSDPSVINLDEYVLNTEAHPLRRPT